MTSTIITVSIGVGLLFAGFLGGYVIAEQTYSPRNMMMNDPQTTTQWMDTMMGTMMNDPGLREQMINEMVKNQQFMQDMMQNSQMMEMMSNMMDSSMMSQKMQGQDMMNGMMTGSEMPFNPDVQITIPMIDGYYNGEKVYFIHTEISDKDMASMMSMMVNFPTLHVSNLKNISPEETSRVYVFTNGISGSGPYGGGPFMYQIDVFDSIPEQIEYSQFRVPHLVTWNDNSTPRLLTSVEEILQAESNGELTIQQTENVVNAPTIVWKSGGMEQRASMIQRMFESMPEIESEVTNVDVDNYVVMLKMHSQSSMAMMEKEVVNP
ncbi:DUF7482 domain-containing protein [Nitrosopumilus ureiphilus]|uniref:DUF7482 domain-containing protein n=1 Tax=Nitrosopumilus ureiphilus TaxID=1470067 RepID=A0A7D5R8E5_9ARCH|nr:hypothetical protein [Nitrosopumilus ureiphilus]QLH07479.1 hypothetical protein C5F50_10650 [Nitrosopumilus ureiphilus]